MSGSRFAAVLFDLDGVLVDSRDAIARSMNHALVAARLAAWPEERLHPLIGPPLHDAFAEVLREQDADPELAEVCVRHYRERYARTCVDETRAMPGIAETLPALAAHLPLAVATSKPVEFAGPILARLGLDGPFRAVVGPALDARSEPKAKTVARALAALGVSAPAAIVGDRRHDVVAGQRCGLVTVGVLWGIGSADELRDAGADHLVREPSELTSLLL